MRSSPPYKAALAGASKVPVVCLAGSDGVYAEWGAELIAALRAAGARWVILAGRAELDADESVATGLDALAFLHRSREKLGMNA